MPLRMSSEKHGPSLEGPCHNGGRGIPVPLQHLLFSIAVFGQLFAAIPLVFIQSDIGAGRMLVAIADVGFMIATSGWLLGVHLRLLVAC